jgi:uncharacterized protein YjfI (DUF2170 family)
VVIHDLLEKQGGKPKVVTRDALLRTVAINDKQNVIAIGDDFGKIYIIHNVKQVIVQTLHWHANKVNSLQFVP